MLRKILKISGIVLAILAVALTCFHFWFIHRSVKLLEDFVTEQSGGRYQLKITKLRYNYAKLIFQLEKPTLTSLDSTSSSDTYSASAEKVTINLKSLFPLVFKKELRFDSVRIDLPQITILHQKSKDTTTTVNKQLNITQDMFNAYNSLQNVLGQLQVDKFSLRYGSFAINYANQPLQHPFQITGIDFTVTGLNIKSKETPTYDPLAITDSIGLALAGQKIDFPDGKKSISFKAFQFNSVTGSITLDSFQVISRSDTTQNNFDVFAEKLSLKKFRLFARNGTDFTQIDSVFFTKPVARLVLETGGGNKKDSSASIYTTLHKVVETVTGNGSVNYIGINNVKFDITAINKDKQSNFEFLQDKLEIGDVLLSKDSILPISIGSLRFGLKQYTNYFDDSAYFIQFDSIRIVNGQIALYDFDLRSTPKAPQLQQIHIPVLILNGVDWYRLIFSGHFNAKNITLNNPQIIISAPNGNNKSGGAKRSFREVFSTDHLQMQNANIKVLFGKNEYAQVKNLSMNANTGTWFRRPSFASALAMLQGTGATEIAFVKSGWNARVPGPKLSSNGEALIPNLTIINKQKGINVKAENLKLANLQVNNNADLVTIGSLSWKSIIGDIALPEMASKKTMPASKPTIKLAAVNGGLVNVHLHSSKLDALVDVSSIKTGRIAIDSGRLDTMQDLAIKGNKWRFTNPSIEAKGASFDIAQQKLSHFNTIEVTTKPPGELITAIIPQITFSGDMVKVANQQMVFDFVKIHQPKANIVVTYPPAADATNTNAAQEFPLVQLNKAEILQPDISFTRIGTQNHDTTLRIHLADAYFSAGVFSSGNQFNLRNVVFQAGILNFNKSDSVTAGLNNGKMNVSIGNFFLYKKAPDVWKFSEAALALSNAELKIKGDSVKRDTVLVPSFVVKHFAGSANTVKDWRKLIFTQPALQLQNVSLRYRNNANIFMVDDLNTTLGNNKITMSSFFFHPQLDEEAFIKAHYYETDFIRAKTGSLTIYDFDRQAFLRDSTVSIRHISIDDVDFRDTRDKTPPFLANVIKPLPISMIKKIPFPIKIDSLTLQKANITYKEVSEKTGQAGTVYFTRTDSKFLNLKNRNQTIRDTFQWNSNAYMMDSMPFFLGIKAAYKDSLDELFLTVRLSPTELPLLNPFFAPLEAISFKSGSLKMLELNVIANDYIGHGQMKFFYNDLNIEFLSNSDTSKKGFIKSIMTFLANKLVLKKKNDHRIGTVYFERIRDRSIFNYIVKLTVNGMKSSIGVQKSSKMEKAYRKKLSEMGWKPLED